MFIMKLVVFLAASCALLMLAAVPASASINISADVRVGNSVTIDYAPQWQAHNPAAGGPFQMTSGNSVWTTFCVESDGATEYFNPGSTYTILGIDSHVATNTGNYITDAAKWLYYQLGHSPSSVLAISDSSFSDLCSLQSAIWFLTNKKPNSTTSASPLPGDANHLAVGLDSTAVRLVGLAEAQNFSSSSEAKAQADRIWVINPGYYGNNEAQSMLFEAVPEPASVAVWASVTGAVGLMLVRRRRRQ
jgi:hypothetical protein